MSNDEPVPPTPPKKPIATYMRFSKLMFRTMKQDNPDYRLKQLHQMIGRRWRHLPEDEKQKYQDQYKQEKAEYHRANAIYLAATEQQEQKVKEKAAQDSVSSMSNDELRPPTPPKKPNSPYVRFASVARPKIRKDNPDLNFRQIANMVGQQWRKMNVDVKQKYIDEYEVENAEYDKAYGRYEKQQREYNECNEMHPPPSYAAHKRRKSWSLHGYSYRMDLPVIAPSRSENVEYNKAYGRYEKQQREYNECNEMHPPPSFAAHKRRTSRSLHGCRMDLPVIAPSRSKIAEYDKAYGRYEKQQQEYNECNEMHPPPSFAAYKRRTSRSLHGYRMDLPVIAPTRSSPYNINRHLNIVKYRVEYEKIQLIATDCLSIIRDIQLNK